jgi:hypothetical protein
MGVRRSNRSCPVRIVLPLAELDVDRYLRLQRPTFERCYTDLSSTLLVTRSGQFATIKAQVAHVAHVDVVDEREFVPEQRLRWDPRPNRGARRHEPTNWFFQQLVKLAVIATLDDDFVLVVDGDVLAEFPVRDSDLAHDGRALRPREAIVYPAWLRWSAQTLGVAEIDYQAAVSPSVVSPAAVRELAAFVEEHVTVNGPRLRSVQWVPGLRGLATSWRGRLLGHKWTEYQLYDTFLVTVGRFDTYHFDDGRVLSGNEVHSPADFDRWVPADRAVQPPHFFSVVQSRADIPVDSVEARLRAASLV